MQFAKQEVIKYKARDGLELEGLLIRPLNEKPGERVPLVLTVHGGPESHYSNGWLTLYHSLGQVAAAKGNLDRFKDDRTSLVGLEKPLFELKNPGLISIPLGFLAVIIGSLLYRDKRAEDMWDELYVRQNTGILAAKAHAH